MSHIPGKFVWFEHVSGDSKKAQAFYEGLFGWSTQSMPMGGQSYDLIMLGKDGIGGYRGAAMGVPAHWASYLSVEDVDKATRAAKAAGAQVLSEPTDYAAVGRGAVIQDPTGAQVALWKGAQDDPADAEKTPIGGWFWSELHSSDPKKASAFYAKAVGHTEDAMDMGPMGTYYILKSADGKMRAGITQSQDKATPSHWLVYVHVADCDAATRKAMELGARQTLVPPTDIPDIGRFSIVLDPLGAPIALMKGAG